MRANKRPTPTSVLLGRMLVAALLASTVTACWASGEDREPLDALHDPETVYRLDPVDGSVLGEMPLLARIPVGQGFGRVVLGADVWVLNSADQTISRVDEARNAVTSTIELGGAEVGDLVLASGDGWISRPSEDHVTRVAAATDEVVSMIPARSLPQGVVETYGDVWVANHYGRSTGSVWRIDPDTNRVVARIPVGNTPQLGPQWMAAGAGSVWVGVPGLEAVVRIDPERNAVVATVPVADGGVCGSLFADDESVWVPSGGCGQAALTRIDPDTNKVVTRITSQEWSAVFTGALGFGSLWVGTDAGTFEIDPATNQIVSRLSLAGDPDIGGNLAVGADSLWIHDGLNASLIRIDPRSP